jgi:hypothetical protein
MVGPGSLWIGQTDTRPCGWRLCESRQTREKTKKKRKSRTDGGVEDVWDYKNRIRVQSDRP